MRNTSILKKFKCDDFCLVSTALDPTIKLMPNIGTTVDQLEYSSAIDCLMYAMTSTRPYIVYVVGKLSAYTSNPSTHHKHAVMRVFKYLKKTMDYGLSYVGFPLVLEGYSDASWITNSEDHTSITGWVSSPDGDYLVIYRANGNFKAFNYLMEVLHIFDRKDLYHLYNLMLEQYSETTLEGIELILWGDLKIMMESSTEENANRIRSTSNLEIDKLWSLPY
ncbi:hypothetical protein Tco_1509041 [Tanacetum coccineum]